MDSAGTSSSQIEPVATLPLLPSLSPAFTRSMDSWSERIITRAKRGIRSGVVRWLWDRQYWYQRGGDAWVDDRWWVDVARAALAENARDTNALKVLLANEPENYHDAAQAAIEDWQANGGLNPDAWEGVLEHFYPELPAARQYFETRYSYTSLGAAAACFRVGFRGARNDLRQAYLDYRNRKELTVLADALVSLGPELLPQVLSQPELDRVHADCLEICEQSPDWADVFAGQGAALRWAYAMDWGDIPRRLALNGSYPQALIFGPSGRSRLSIHGLVGSKVERSPRDALVDALRQHLGRLPSGDGAPPPAPCRLTWTWHDVELLLWSLTLPGDLCAQLAAAAASVSKLCRGVDFHYRLLIAISWRRARAANAAKAEHDAEEMASAGPTPPGGG